MQRDAELRIRTVAARQHGVLTRRQCLQAGLSDQALAHRVSIGHLVRLHAGVVGLIGAMTEDSAIMAACLASRGVASHRTSGMLHRLPIAPFSKIDVRSSQVRRASFEGVVVHRESVPRPLRCTIRGIPATRPVPTLFDLASCVTRAELEDAHDEFLRRGTVKLADLRQALDDSPTRPGIPLLREIVEDRSQHGVPGSVLESAFLRLLEGTGLPMPIRQEAHHADGLVRRVDFAYPQWRIVIEVDGNRFHGTRQAQINDRRRQNRITARGRLFLRFTWWDVHHDAAYVLNTVAEAVGYEPVRWSPPTEIAR